MAEQVVDSLVFELSASSDKLLAGLENATKSLDALASKFQSLGNALDALVGNISNLGDKARDALEKVGKGVDDNSDKTRSGANDVANSSRLIEKAFGKVGDAVSRVGEKISSVFSTGANSPIKGYLLQLLGVGSVLEGVRSSFYRGVDIDKFARRTGADVVDAQAFATATELGGGTYESGLATYEGWIRSGRPIEQLIGLSKRVDQNNPAFSTKQLQQLGVQDPTALVAYGDKFRDVFEKSKETAFTPEQIRNFRELRDNFKVLAFYAQKFFASLADVATVPLLKVVKGVANVFRALQKDPETLKKILEIVVFLIGTKLLLSTAKLLGLFKLLGFVLKPLGKMAFAQKLAKGLRVAYKLLGHGKLLSAVKLLGLALGRAFLPVTLIIGAIAGIAVGCTLIAKHWDTIKAKILECVEAVRKFLSEMPAIGWLFKTEEEKKDTIKSYQELRDSSEKGIDDGIAEQFAPMVAEATKNKKSEPDSNYGRGFDNFSQYVNRATEEGTPNVASDADSILTKATEINDNHAVSNSATNTYNITQENTFNNAKNPQEMPSVLLTDLNKASKYLVLGNSGVKK